MTCPTGKQSFRTELDAKMALAFIARKRHTGRAKEESRAYRCESCRRWHLTSKPVWVA
jgi:hypothetical protein